MMAAGVWTRKNLVKYMNSGATGLKAKIRKALFSKLKTPADE